MAYKNKLDQLACQKRHYLRNCQKRKDEAAVRKQRVIDFMVQYKSERGCYLCGEKHPARLDFHHLGEKTVNISSAVRQLGWSIQKVSVEIEKCVVVCCNCHRKIHWQETHAPVV